MTRWFVVVLLVACELDPSPAPLQEVPDAVERPDAVAPLAEATLSVSVDDERALARPSARIDGVTDLRVRLRYRLPIPAGEATLDVHLPTGAPLLSVVGQRRPGYFEFTIPVAGAPIGRRRLTGTYSLIASVAGRPVAGTLFDLVDGGGR